MRVFIALELEQTVREQLAALQTQLKPCIHKGNFSRPENFHITIHFLGERTQQEVHLLMRCIQNAAQTHAAFSLESCGLGCFHKKRDICYASVEPHDTLLSVHRALQNKLCQKQLISRKEECYTPHITLAREIVWKQPYMQIFERIDQQPIFIHVSGLSLMESTRIDGQLCYVPLFYQGFSAKEV